MTDKTDSKERDAFKAAHRHLELDEVPDAWGRPMFKHSHIEASWLGWQARASLAANAGSEPVAWFVEEHSDVQDLEWNRLKPTYPGNWKPLYTHPSPPEGAGAELSEWVSMPRVLPLHGPLRDVLIDWVGRAVKGECYLYSAFWDALIAAAPPASEAKGA